MFKVLQLCNKAPFPPNDGSSIAIYNMAIGLIANDVDLHLLTINTKKHFKPDSGLPSEFKNRSNYRSVYKNTSTSIFGAITNLFSSRSYFVSRFKFDAFEDELVRVLKATTFDIIQLEGVFMGIYIPVIKKYSKAQIVLRAHNVEHFIWNRHIFNEKKLVKKVYLSLQNKRLKRFEMEVLSSVDAIVPITETDKNTFKELGFQKPIFSCITGVDVKSYQQKSTLPEKEKTVFYFASMDWLPNQEAVEWFLDNCWDKIHKQIPDARFIIAGRGMPQNLIHLRKSNVLIVENVMDGKTFFQQHQVMIVPLLSGSGLRIKIIEGMAYGKAIVSTTIGCEGIKTTHNKNILIADSPEDFINCVVNLLNNPAKRHELEKQATDFAYKEFNNSEVVATLVEFYKQLLNVPVGVNHTL